MTKSPTELQVSLAVDVWDLAERRAWLATQLAEVDDLHKKAIALAATYGVPQKRLAELCGVSGPRISQIATTTELPSGSMESFHLSVTELLERRQASLQRLEPEDKAIWDRKFAITRGQEPTLPR